MADEVVKRSAAEDIETTVKVIKITVEDPGLKARHPFPLGRILEDFVHRLNADDYPVLKYEVEDGVRPHEEEVASESISRSETQRTVDSEKDKKEEGC